MNRICTVCQEEFEEPARRGRPSAFCGAECRETARKNPKRNCTECGEPFFKNESPYIWHCSPACRSVATSSCLYCKQPTESSGRFCSGECVSAHAGPKECLTCGQPVPAPTAPPFKTMPRYCSHECRSYASLRHDAPSNNKILQEYGKMISFFGKPAFQLPIKRFGHPYPISPALAQTILQTRPSPWPLSAKVLNSINWWNHLIPRLRESIPGDHPNKFVLFLAHSGLNGWGGIDTPTGCRTLAECWPFLKLGALTQQESSEIGNIWRAAAKSRPLSQSALTELRLKLEPLIDDYWSAEPKAPELLIGSPSPLIQMINKWLRANQVPQPSRYLAKGDVEWVTSKPIKDFTFKLNTEFLQHSPVWCQADYSDDPTPHEDRFSKEIFEILEIEGKKSG